LDGFTITFVHKQCPDIRSASLSHETQRILKTKLQIYPDPRHWLCILLCTVPQSTVNKQHRCQGFGCGLQSCGIGAAIRSIKNICI